MAARPRHGARATGKLDEARRGDDELRTLARRLPTDMMAGSSTATTLLELAAKVLEARIAERTKDPRRARAVGRGGRARRQAALREPADWFYPVRHYQGAALLDAGKAPEAEAVYRDDLKRNPNNGWALFGLTQALKAQKKTRTPRLRRISRSRRNGRKSSHPGQHRNPQLGGLGHERALREHVSVRRVVTLRSFRREPRTKHTLWLPRRIHS